MIMPPKKAEVKPDDEYVSLTQVLELLHQQKEMFSALLRQQQENFQGFVKLLMDSTNTKMEEITREIQEIKTSLQFTQKDVDDRKADNAKQTEHCNSMQSDIFKMCDSLLAVTDKMEYLEGQSRRNNLVFDGIMESPGETWAETEEKVKKVVAEKLQLQREIEVERAHRTGKPGGDRPRPIVVKLLRHKDRSAILQRTKSLKGSKIFINEDFTEAVRRKRKELMPDLRAARERGDIAYLRHDRLIVHPRASTPKQPRDT